jgi:hypothetical protein
MKQGTGKSRYDHGTQGVAHSVSLENVSRMGAHETGPQEPLYTGKKAGQAPSCSCTTHHSGSQGKH